MGDAEHRAGIEYLVERLLEKGRKPFKNVELYKGRYRVSDADVLTIERANDKTYMTRYEVKSGNGRRTARKQAAEWYRYCSRMPGVVANIVYYNCRDQVIERWKKNERI